jgi:ABC-type Fe3+-hydroxamate transport system substrate-binding protein
VRRVDWHDDERVLAWDPEIIIAIDQTFAR